MNAARVPDAAQEQESFSELQPGSWDRGCQAGMLRTVSFSRIPGRSTPSRHEGGRRVIHFFGRGLHPEKYCAGDLAGLGVRDGLSDMLYEVLLI